MLLNLAFYLCFLTKETQFFFVFKGRNYPFYELTQIKALRLIVKMTMMMIDYKCEKTHSEFKKKKIKLISKIHRKVYDENFVVEKIMSS